jgi:hypothetical protein
VTSRIRRSQLFIGFDGDSFNNEPVSPNTYPELLSAELRATYRNVGTNGSFTSLKLKGTRGNLGPYANAGEITIGHILTGTNDIALGGASGVYENKVLMADIMRDAGFDYIVTGTSMPSQHFTGPQETARLAANVELLADASTAFDLILNWGALDSGFNNYAGAYFYTATVVSHWSAAGSARAVELAAPLIEGMLP